MLVPPGDTLLTSTRMFVVESRSKPQDASVLARRLNLDPLAPRPQGSHLLCVQLTKWVGMLPNQLPTGYPWWSESALRQGLREHDNVEELSEAWGCATSTLYNWIDRHGIDTEAV